MMINLNEFKSQEELLSSFCKEIINNLQKAIKEKGKASLLLSGGSTPKPLFEALSKIDIAWEKVNVGLCDERWIDSSSKNSNENLVKTNLFKNYAQKANFVSMFIKDLDINEAKDLCSQNIKNSLFPFDVLVLGMGEDGHTASIFPNNIKLDEAYDLNSECLCVNMIPSDAPYERMSLNKKAILSASNIYLHFEGEKKQEVFNQALKANAYDMPIASILNNENKTIEVYTK